MSSRRSSSSQQEVTRKSFIVEIYCTNRGRCIVPVIGRDFSPGRPGKDRKNSSNVLAFAAILTAILMLGPAAVLTAPTGNSREPLLSESPVINHARIAYTAHNPISIVGNGGFTTANGVSGGTGTASNPYIIANWDIDASSVVDGIWINGTNAHFIIRNCYIHDGEANYNNGIDLSDCSNGTLENNICSHNYRGIYLTRSNHSILNHNNCSSNSESGIGLGDSNYNNLANNTCSSNCWDGIYLGSSSNNTVVANTCHLNYFDGLGIDPLSNHNTISKNTCISNGYDGIGIHRSSENNTISYNNCSSNSWDGIYLTSSSNNALVGNTCCLNYFDGLRVNSLSNHNTISKNTCISNSYDGIGIYLSSENNTISYNNCSSNSWDGIRVGSSSNNTLIANTCCLNYFDGLGMDSLSNHNSLNNNTFSSNHEYGMFLSSSAGNVISWNHVCNNIFQGVYIDSGSNNKVWDNTFMGNNHAGSVYDPANVQGCDFGMNNWWNSSRGFGNYWSDWTTPDVTPPLGIVDQPYDIAGSAGDKDYYPLARPPLLAFTLNLVKGWNFVTVPLVGQGYKASTLGLVTGDMISSWAPATQKYDKTYIKGISPSVLDFVIAQNVGYWIWVAVAKPLTLTGIIPTTAQSYVFTVPLMGGWIALGFESMKTTVRAADVPEMYSGTGAITMVAYYNTATAKYSSWVSAVPALNNFLLTPGVAFWCWVTAGPGGTITYVP